MKKQILTVIPLVICIVSAFSQTTELNRMKYDFYRMNLLTKFMFFSDDGMKQGSCQPMESLRSERDGGKTAYWADGTWWQGHYIALLATEYARLRMEGDTLSASSTLRELHQALRVYVRLDSMAETCWNGRPACNGFYLRDDVPGSMGFDGLKIVSDYQRRCGDTLSTSNGPSQDQAWATYLGLALVLRLVDGDSTAEVRELAANVARQMVRGMQHTDAKGREHWQVVNPVNGILVQKEGDIQWLKYAHARAYQVLTGEEIRFGKALSATSRRTFKVIQNNFLIDKHGHFNWYGVLALSTVINEKGSGGKCTYDWLVDRTQALAKKRPDLEQPIMFPHFPLISLLLYPQQPSKMLPASFYEDLLGGAPNEGAYRRVLSGGQVEHTGAPWHTLSLFCPWHNEDTGDFNMIDYMLLYNPYRLVYSDVR